jgi:hypothetical protein
MADHSVGAVEDLTNKRELISAVLPKRREHVVDDTVGKQPPDHSGVSMHGVQVRVVVTSTDR